MTLLIIKYIFIEEQNIVNGPFLTEPQYQNNNFINKNNNQKSSITIAIRVRPLSKNELELSSVESVKVISNTSLSVSGEVSNKKNNQIKEQQFFFDNVFDKNSSQQEIYTKTTKLLLNGIIEGYNATVFAYGATGSGKTYTMLGTQTEKGIMPRAVTDLFKILQNYKKKEFKIQISYIEIYNEEIRDLLGEREELKLHEDPVKGIVIQGVKEIIVENVDNFYDLLYKGNQKRTVGKTNANEASSRSHALLKINIENKDKEGPNSTNVICGRFILVDLAGSEKTNSVINNNSNNNNNKKNVNKNNVRQQEGANINKSLLNLGICINALASKSKFIPWRNSKLTHILKDCIGGNSRIVMISTISPSLFCVDETFNTLNYSNRAKNITTIIKKNVISVVDRDSQVSKYREIISNLTDELEAKRNQLAVITNNKYLLPKKDLNNNSIDNGPNLKMDKLTKEITSHFNEEIRVKNEILDIQRNISNLINNLRDKEFNLYKLVNKQQNNNNNKGRLNGVNSNMNMNNYLKEKDIRSSIKKINDQIQSQKSILITKEAKYNELFSKRGNLENAIGKFGNSSNLNSNNNSFVDNAQNFSALQYLYHSFILEINNLENDFVRKQNTNEIVSKDIKINKLIEQLKIRDEFIKEEKKSLAKKKINFVFEGEKDIKKVEDLNVDKSISLPFIIQQDNNALHSGTSNIVSKTLTNANRQILSPLNNMNNMSRHRVAIMSNGQYDYSGYSNPNIIMEKKVIRTKTNEIMKKTKNNQLSELKLNMLNDQYKNSRVMYVNKRHLGNRSFHEDDNVITFDTRKLNKSQSYGTISQKSQNDSFNNSGFGKSGIFNYKEREIDNKIKRVMIGKKKASPYLK